MLFLFWPQSQLVVRVVMFAVSVAKQSVLLATRSIIVLGKTEFDMLIGLRAMAYFPGA